MFEKKIKTKDLCLLEIARQTKHISNFVQGTIIEFDPQVRYTLKTLKKSMMFIKIYLPAHHITICLMSKEDKNVTLKFKIS